MKKKRFKPNLPGILKRKDSSPGNEEEMVKQNDAIRKSTKEIDQEFFLGGEEPVKIDLKTETHGKKIKTLN